MLMKDNKKNVAAIIVSKMGKNPSEGEMMPNEEGGMPDNEIAINSAAEELMSALESKDPKAVVSALKSFIELCDEEEPSESEEYKE